MDFNNDSNFDRLFNSIINGEGDENSNFFIDNNAYFWTIQNNINLEMENIMMVPQKTTKSSHFNEVSKDKDKDKEELKENNNNNNDKAITIYDLNSKKPAVNKQKKNKDIAIITANKEEKNIIKGKHLYNKIRQVKIFILNVIIKYCNYIISRVYNNKKSKGIFSTLKTINSSQIICGKKDYNIELLNKTLKDIISMEVNKKYTFPSNINAIIIGKLLNEKDEEKRKIFNDLFNKTFREWIGYFKDPKDELKNIYEKEIQLKDNKNEMIIIIENFENIVEKTKTKKNKK